MRVRNLYAFAGVTALGASQLLAGQVFATATVDDKSGIGIGGNSDFSNYTSDSSFSSLFANTANTVLTIITLIAGILAIMYLVWSGVQYITSTGSPEKAKTARQGIINAIIGIVIIVGAFFIVRVALGIGNEVAVTPS